MTQQYDILLHPDLEDDLERLRVASEQEPDGIEAREYAAVMEALDALEEGRETDYKGKQLSYGLDSHDLRDCAELKVPVIRRFTLTGQETDNPSHRLTYQEFDPEPTALNQNPLPIRHAIAFVHRDDRPEPTAVTGQRLGRERGVALSELEGLGAARVTTAQQTPGAKITPDRVQVPDEMIPDVWALHQDILDGQAPAWRAAVAPDPDALKTPAAQRHGQGQGQDAGRSGQAPQSR